MKKSAFVICIVAVCSMLLSACVKTQLQAGVDEMNRSLPQQIGEGVEWTKVTYENDEVSMFFSTTNSIVVKAINSDYNLAKRYLAQQFISNDPEIRDFLELLQEAKSGLKVIYKDIASGNQSTISYSVSEIPQLRNNYTSDPLIALRFELLSANLMMPLQVDEITTCYKVSLDGNFVVYEEHIDDSYIDMSEIKYSSYLKQDLKKTIRETLSFAQQFDYFVEKCVKADKGVRYHYIGEYSNVSFDIDFTVSELRSLLNY